jgi:CubicO group peptidase (beta-lactamase class C family)
MDEKALGRVRDLVPLLDGWLAFHRWYHEVPSLAVGMSVGDEVVYAEGHGLADRQASVPATAETRYRIASHSKVFTATAVMQLIESGDLRIDDPIVQHLEWFGPPDGDLRHVTVRHLMCHAGGLTRDGVTTHWFDDRFPTLDELVAQVETGMSVVGPVEKLKYSNVGFTLLGQVIESVTGLPYEQHVAHAILAPLGLASTTPDLPDFLDGHAVGYSMRLPDEDRTPFDHVRAGVMNSATGFSSTVLDLLRWYRAHRFGSGELFPDRVKREMQRLQFEAKTMRWGLGFQLAEHGGLDFVTHGGGYPGFITYSGLAQEHELAIVVLTNAIDGPARDVFEGVATLAKRALTGEFDTAEPTLDHASADAVCGVYRKRWSIEQVARVGDRLVELYPMLANPSPSLQVLEHVEALRFSYPDTLPTGSPGEQVWFEASDPPVMHAPATPPIRRSPETWR